MQSELLYAIGAALLHLASAAPPSAIQPQGPLRTQSPFLFTPLNELIATSLDPDVQQNNPQLQPFGKTPLKDVLASELSAAERPRKFPVSAPPPAAYDIFDSKHLIIFFSAAAGPAGAPETVQGTLAMEKAVELMQIRLLGAKARGIPEGQIQANGDEGGFRGVLELENPKQGEGKGKACEVDLALTGLGFWNTMVQANQARIQMYWMVVDEKTESACTFYSRVRKITGDVVPGGNGDPRVVG